MYIFAGTSHASGGTSFNFDDLHRYDVQLDSWTELTGTSGRSSHTAVWDGTSGRMIVFGGLDNNVNKLGSLVEYDRTTDSWSSPVAVGPAARDGHVAVWDPAAGSMLMCCGASSGTTLGDLWSYNGAWSQLAPSGSITARSYASAVWDPQAGALMGFAGSGGSRLNSLFLYSASTNSWSEFTETGPPAQDRGAAAWDPVNGRLYAFGGYGDGNQQHGLLGSLWKFDASHTAMASTTVMASGTTTTSASSTSTTQSTTTRSTVSFTSTSSTSTAASFTSAAETSLTTTSRTTAVTTATLTTITQTSSTASASTAMSVTSSSTSTTTSTVATSVTTSSTTLTFSFATSTTATLTTSTSTRSTSTLVTSSSTTTRSTTTSVTSTSSTATTTSARSSTTSVTSTSSTTTKSITASVTSTRSSTKPVTSTSSTATTSSSYASTTSSSGTTSSTRSRSTTYTETSRTEALTSRSSTMITTGTSTTFALTSGTPIETSTAMSSTTATDTSASMASSVDLLLSDLDRSEEEVARQLVAQLGNSSNSSGILGSLLTQSDFATTQTLALDSVAIFGQSHNITVLSENATVEVPSGVVTQAAASVGGSGLVLLSISVGSSELRGGFDGTNEAAEGGGVVGDGPSLVSRPVSIAFRKPDGQRIPMPSLVQPIEIRLPGASEEAECAFWDEETSAWSSKGLLRLAHEDGELICQTSHLTVFGAVLDVLLQVIRCSTASQVLSAEGFANFGKGKWTGRSPTVIAFIAVFVFVLLLLYALRLDARRALSREEVEAALLVELEEDTPHELDDSDDQEPEVKQAHRPNICQRAAAWMLSRFMWFLSQIFEMPDANMLKELMNAKVVTINRCISSIYAYKSHADRQSIRASETAVGHARMRPSNIAGASVTVVDFVRMDMATTKETSKASAVREFLRSFWCKRVVLLMRAMHPWITMQYVSLFRSHVVRASLITLKLVSTGAANALFFAASAVSADSQRDCGPPETFGERLLRAGVVGILSACMGDLLILLLAAVQWRQVIVRHWTEETKKRQLRSWRCRRCFFWLLWFLDIGVSILYIFGFLANVSEKDASKWLESTGISLLQDLLLKPLYMALLYGTGATMVLCCSPSVENEIVGQWIRGDEDHTSRDDAHTRPQSHALRPVCECDTEEIHEIYIDTV